MKLLELIEQNPNENYLNQAVEALENGEVIIIPTDTVYAFACDALNNRAIEQICLIKGNKVEKSRLSIVCNSISHASEYARVDDSSYRMMRDYLPGPFTFLLPALSKLPKAFKGRKTVGVRVCDNNITSKLTEMLGRPLMVSSVPIHDVDDTEPSLLAERYAQRVSIVLDAGRGGDVPSTVLDSTGIDIEVLRQGKGVL